MSTGHATHFLSRLERTDPIETELALALYRDSRVVELFLHYAEVPEQFHRIALSLNSADRGPFMVVARDGSFVTCLGRGMGTNDLYVVGFERLQHYKSKSAEVARRLEMAKEMSGERSALSLLDRLATLGHAVSREDFQAVSVLQPVLKGAFLGLLGEMLIAYDEQLRSLGRLKHASRRTEPPLRTLWETYQMIGHLVLLSLMDGRALLDDEAMEHLFQLLFFVYDVGTIHMSSRALWAVGRVGKPLVARCKDAVQSPASGAMLFFGLSGLAALGLRHRRLRAEVSKSFKFDEETIRNLPDAALEYLREIGFDPFGYHAELIERPDDVGAPVLDHLEAVAHENLQQIDPPEAHRYAGPADVPEDIAVSWALILPGDIRTDTTLSTSLLSLIPYISQSEAELFYLPRDLLECLDWSWQPDLSLHLVSSDRRTNPSRKPATRGFNEVGRNEPCPCGSGKKFKKCHGGTKQT